MKNRLLLLAATGAAASLASIATAGAAPVPAAAAAETSDTLESVVITARRRAESSKDVPLAISVVSGELIEATGAFNVGRLQQLAPSLNFYSSNPRNTAINIRGIGVPFGLTNDGFDQGVGLYVDDVYYARVAAATFDFLDVERIEVLRGRRARCTARTPRPARSTSPRGRRRPASRRVPS